MRGCPSPSRCSDSSSSSPWPCPSLPFLSSAGSSWSWGSAHTRTAALTIGAAAVDDVAGWMILGAISLLVKGAFSWAWALPRVVGLAAYVGLVLFVVRRPLVQALARHVERHGGLGTTSVPSIVI